MIRFLQAPGKTKKIVLGGLLVIICGAMVITLVPGGILGDAFGFGAPQGDVLVRVGDEQITVAEVQQAANNMGKQQFPRGFPQTFKPCLMQRAAEQLIQQKAMIAEAHKMGFNVTDEEVQNEIRRIPDLFPNGQFIGQQSYESIIQQNYNMGAQQWEQTVVKPAILIRKLLAAISGGVTVSDKDIAEMYQRETTKVKFDYAVLTLENISKQIDR